MNRIKSLLSQLRHQMDDVNPLIEWRLRHYRDGYVILPLLLFFGVGLSVFFISYTFEYSFEDCIVLIQYGIGIAEFLLIMGVSKFVENMRAMMEHQDELFKLNSLSKKEKDAEDIVLSIIPVLVFWCYLFIVVIVLTILGGSFLTLFLTISVPILIWVMFCLGMGVTNLIGMESKGRELLLAVPEFVYFTVWGVAFVALLVMVRTTSMPLIDLINTVNPCLFLGLCCNCCAFMVLCRDAWKTDPQTSFAGMRKKVSVLLCLSVVNAVLWLVAYVQVLLSLQ